ncbi:shikimate dehydrogenase [Lysobacter sp. TY2-98]|uniref:shikimate dehydrogenase n=1 Tax=Lysobacter sp. TY2-98 TaxID=2290922 RepID=UPI000E20C618|nr:shikimate dehydrogenase [Lysobacter sp. TY2-98]AXK73073.1 shikimate dehydrogenase [Lysobacter sp. TY2-98]
MHRNRFAVFGHPVAHSRSPFIHAAFAAQCGIDLEYTRVDATPDDFVQALADFAQDGGRGANVTLPHKNAAAMLCATRSERAERAGAVNTLVRLDDVDGAARWHGDNTDGVGLVRDLRDRHGVALEGACLLLIGAGGAAAGVAPALLDAGVATLAITNRSTDRLSALAERLADHRVVASPWSMHASLDTDATPDTRPIDIVINTTSAARSDADVTWPFPAALSNGWTAVDLGYGDTARAFLDAATQAGAATCIDGLGMLVEQAAESFRLWHGVMPDTAPVYAALRHDRDRT